MDCCSPCEASKNELIKREGFSVEVSKDDEDGRTIRIIIGKQVETISRLESLERAWRLFM